ncbi:MAG: hypothetical protein ACRDKT_06455 [Actinomycetota bacterium]
MGDLWARRRPAFIFAASIVVIVSIAVARLPDSLVVSIENSRAFTNDQAGWAYRLLALAAIAQAFYGGFAILRIDRVKRALENDPKIAEMAHERVIASLSRNAAGMVMWTLIYGVAAFVITGERGGFWLFPLACLLQLAWYFREIGAIARWLEFQPEPQQGRAIAAWVREPSGYVPPIARALVPRADEREDTEPRPA